MLAVVYQPSCYRTVLARVQFPAPPPPESAGIFTCAWNAPHFRMTEFGMVR